MKCDRCGKKLKDIEYIFCPYCGCRIEHVQKYTISSVIKMIIAEKGIDIIKTPNIINGYIKDLVVGYEKEKKLLSNVINKDALQILKELYDCDDDQVCVIVNKYKKLYEEEFFLSSYYAGVLINIFLEALSLNYKMVGEELVLENKEMPPVMILQKANNERNNTEKHKTILEKIEEVQRRNALSRDVKISNFNIGSSVLHYEIGKSICIGNYYQKDYKSKKNPIEWVIINISNNTATLLCKKCIETHAFEEIKIKENHVSWYDSSCRRWLNEKLYKKMFTEIEQMVIEASDDKIRLLREREYEEIYDEINKGKISDSILSNCEPTELTADKFMNNRFSSAAFWWLGEDASLKNAKIVTPFYIVKEYMGSSNIGIRPVIKVNISKCIELIKGKN